MGASRREVRHRDQPLLLGRRDPGDGVRRRLHDAVLLRLARALGARVPASCGSTRRRAASTRSRSPLMTVFSSGISMYAMGEAAATLLLGWDFTRLSVLRRRRSIVLVYIYLGGLTSRDLQRGAAVLPDRRRLRAAGVARAARRRRLGGPDGAADAGGDRAASRQARDQSWRHWAAPATNPMGVEWFGLVMGLGFVLSFGYWCTDFLVVQRAMAADSMTAARRTPLIAAVPEDAVPVPGDPARHDRAGARRSGHGGGAG